MSNDLLDFGVIQASQALASGDCSSEELTKACLQQIHVREPEIKAFLTVTDELAIQQAKAADEKIASLRKNGEKPTSLLLGIPFAIKDVLCVKGLACTCGSKILENFVPPYHATAVKKLLDQGMVLLGKTNMDEFAMGSSTENSAYQITHNPWNTERVPGGSSGGSAAAVAAHMAPITLGSDTGGSIRQPASFCGVTGLKPTYGRISRYGLIAYGSSLDSVGFLAHSAADLVPAFQTASGFDGLDATSVDQPVPQIRLNDDTQCKGLRIGVPQEYFIEGIQPAVEKAVRQAIEQMKSLGAEIVPISLAHTDMAVPVYYLIAPAEASANLARFDGIRYGLRVPAESLWDTFVESKSAGFGAEVKRRIMLGTYALSAGYYDAYYGQAQKVRTLIKQDFDQAFQQVDVIAAPVSPTTAFKIGAHSDSPLEMYLQDVFTLPANLAGVPGISFPVGYDDDNMPIGMQFMGAPFSEPLLLQTAHRYQLSSDWHQRKITA
ncbi:MAG: Asp-tRNA(Asn)/Glu-tRNA(Gln) amidotransferase subunit GatA [Anaerolineaceae bacterium]|nr:Asp-tRNA(Asn)/Glu-tRNA(Gln) amidotransferase subunit GatA [Anaerolineaceae bacterium]